jgi:radical SAM protein with 4Fe4S-binding SPASM domain
MFIAFTDFLRDCQRAIIKYPKSILKKFFSEKRYKRLQLLYRSKFFNDVLQGIAIDISGMCNLNCAMCSFQDWFGTKGLMPLETFKKLENVLRKVNSLALQCNAEPVLNPHIIECIKFAKSVNNNISISFITNGTLLTTGLISQLLEAGLDKIDISIDGATKTTYEMIRRGAKFETVIENIKELVRQRNSSKNNLKHIGIITVMSKLNICELPDILSLASELGVDSLSVNGCDVYNDEIKDQELYVKSPEDVTGEYERILSSLKNNAVNCNIKLRLPGLWVAPYHSCEINDCIVSWNGDVSPCPVLSYERPYWYFGKKLMHPKVIFGNINEEDLFDIWNSKEFKKFRRDLREGKLPHYCQNCLLRNKVLCSV